MNVEWNLILTALFTSSLGSLVRIAHDNEDKTIGFQHGFLVYICSLTTGYVCYEVAILYDRSWIVGVPSLVLSLGAVEITNVFKKGLGFVFEKLLNAVPDALIEAGRRALNLPPSQKPPNDDIQ